MRTTKQERMYKSWLENIEGTERVVLWDEMDSCRLMDIERDPEDDMQYFCSYWDGVTGERWAGNNEYVWDVVRTLVENDVDIA